MKQLTEVQFDTFIQQLQNTLRSGQSSGSTVKDFVSRRKADLKNRRQIFRYIDKGIESFQAAIDGLEEERG